MKPSKNTMDSLADLDQIRTLGDTRRLIGQSLLALVRKEISATDVLAIAKGVDAISNSLDVEISLVRAAHDLRQAGTDIGTTVHIGLTMIGADPSSHPKTA